MISEDDIWCDRSLVTAPVWYGLCTDEKTFTRQMKEMEVPKNCRPPFISNAWSDATAHCFTKSDGKVVFIVCIRATSMATGIEIAGLLVHEAVHI